MAKQPKKRGRPMGGGLQISDRMSEVARLRDAGKSAKHIAKSTGASLPLINQRIIPSLNVMQQAVRILVLHNQADFNDAQIAAIMDVDESFVSLVLNTYQSNIDKWIA